MSTIRTGNNDLVFVDYGDILDKILQVLRNQESKNLFGVSTDGLRLRINVDAVACQVARLQISNPLGAAANNAKSATVNFSPGCKELFPGKIQAIADCVKQILGDDIEQQRSSTTVKEFVESLVTDLQTFKGDTASLNFTYPFSSYEGLQKQRLTFPDKNNKGKAVLRFHKLTIAVQKTREFNEQLKKGLEQSIKVRFASANEEEREELDYLLDDLYKDKDNPQLDFYRLKRIIDTETLGKLKKKAQINYLEYLYENINTDSSRSHAEAVIYLQDTIRRLRLIEEYINDSNKADGDYIVTYAGVSLNYKDIFSRAEAYEMLPIIPKIEGYLGETTDDERGEIQFILGVKLKFDGKVQAYGGKNVFAYYFNLLDPESQQHKEELADPLRKEVFARKVLKILFLYYCLFAIHPQIPQLEYNPIDNFETKVIKAFQEDDEKKKQKLLSSIVKYFKEYKIQEKISKLKGLLVEAIKYSRTFSTREYPQHLSISQGILEQDINTIINQSTFFKLILKGNPKEVIRYISVGDANIKEDSLCSLPVKITITDIHYVATEDKQTFKMNYEQANISALPILFLPLSDKKCQEVYKNNFLKRKLLVFPYKLENSPLESQELFIYKFTFALLTYICLRVLLHKQNRLFIPILRLHQHTKEDDAPVEKFIASFARVLSHLLNEIHRSNTQGIDIRDLQSKGKFKVPNVLSSLYSVLPKSFTFSNSSDLPTNINKIAIVIVSSRESDRRWNGSQKISNLMGEILLLSCRNSIVRVQLLTTFSDNYENQQMFRNPTVIIDEVTKLYEKGCRHFLYIAKAPYTSTLNMTKTEDDRLFFLSQEVIGAFKSQHRDIKIYPMFFDKYYAVRQSKIDGSSSLYIQDTVELTNLVDDPSKKSVVFFNLFNGVTVGNGGDRYYNGVISYSTFLKIYEGILDDEDIYKGLIFKGELKNEILQYLTLFHFSRYEKARDINLKLDPYENLIGENSVGSLSLFGHMRGKVDFNSLAFLTEVKKILNVQFL
ncbi:hypothetical protein [Scytonema sp. NUACC26]|uniref:hypothetical protein n=1 Tax=Scytonema sp. NUACC26 TaxID=3140176 RepID=UPI0034DC0E3E